MHAYRDAWGTTSNRKKKTLITYTKRSYIFTTLVMRFGTENMTDSWHT